MTKTFTTALAPKKTGICGGFGASGNINPSNWADKIFAGAVPGPWLCCYMLRRFGWPNAGSDDYKQLCTWTLTTPMRGLYLGVTPYLGGSNLHFSLRFTRTVEAGIRRDPGREEFFLRNKNALLHWWKKTGCKLYMWGQGLAKGDPDELVHAYKQEDEKMWGLWKREERHRKTHPYTLPSRDGWVLWWLGGFVEKKHPEVKLPKMNKRERKNIRMRFHLKVEQAIKATLRDLLRPTNVRDISFTPFGDIERSKEEMNRYSNQKSVPYFEGAGNTPEYWFQHGRNERRRK